MLLRQNVIMKTKKCHSSSVVRSETQPRIPREGDCIISISEAPRKKQQESILPMMPSWLEGRSIPFLRKKLLFATMPAHPKPPHQGFLFESILAIRNLPMIGLPTMTLNTSVRAPVKGRKCGHFPGSTAPRFHPQRAMPSRRLQDAPVGRSSGS